MKEKDLTILKTLSGIYGKPETMLEWDTPFQLLTATILSAQCTDNQVNKVTARLFKKHPTAEKMSKARITTLEKIVYSTGFYRQKAENIRETSKIICREYGGRVPDTMHELIRLPGVARKTANIVLTHAFNKTEGIAVDTHVKRISYRLGWTKSTNPVIIERDVMARFDKKHWKKINHVLVNHGRNECRAGKPACNNCPILKHCPRNGI